MYRLVEPHSASGLNVLPRHSNLINFSRLFQLDQTLVFRSFSIKYVIDGTERYQVNGRWYKLHQGDYLLANACCEGHVEVNSRLAVKGLCIDVAPSALSQAFASVAAPDTPFPDLSLDTFFHSEAFLENSYASANTVLGSFLSETGRRFVQNPYTIATPGEEFYFTLAEKLVQDHYPVIASLYPIRVVRHATRKDLFRRLCKGQYFLDQQFHEKIQISEAATYAGLSDYYFFRLFKSAFGMSPQQYLIRQRIAAASNLLKQGASVAETAHSTGFSDIHSFSKAFKKYRGISPSALHTKTGKTNRGDK